MPYRSVKVPEGLMSAIDRLVAKGTLSYRTPAEFVIDAVRRRLEELGVGAKGTMV